MRCKTCLYTKKASKVRQHCWKYGQCPDCHYFGLYKVKDSKHGFGGKRSRGYQHPKGEGSPEYHNIPITAKNIDLYCKISTIIRDKPCTNPKLVLARQKQTFWSATLP